jgi:hypothetical protein
VFPIAQLPDNSSYMATAQTDNAGVGDFPSHLVHAPVRPGYGRLKATTIGVVMLAMCLVLAGAAPVRALHPAPVALAGLDAIGSPLPGTGTKLPAEIQDAGLLRYGTWAADGRNLWQTDDGIFPYGCPGRCWASRIRPLTGSASRYPDP